MSEIEKTDYEKFRELVGKYVSYNNKWLCAGDNDTRMYTYANSKGKMILFSGEVKAEEGFRKGTLLLHLELPTKVYTYEVKLTEPATILKLYKVFNPTFVREIIGETFAVGIGLIEEGIRVMPDQFRLVGITHESEVLSCRVLDNCRAKEVCPILNKDTTIPSLSCSEQNCMYLWQIPFVKDPVFAEAFIKKEIQFPIEELTKKGKLTVHARNTDDIEISLETLRSSSDRFRNKVTVEGDTLRVSCLLNDIGRVVEFELDAMKSPLAFLVEIYRKLGTMTRFTQDRRCYILNENGIIVMKLIGKIPRYDSYEQDTPLLTEFNVVIPLGKSEDVVTAKIYDVEAQHE